MCRPHQTPSAPHRTPFCTRGKPRLREEETCQGHTRGRGTAVARAPGRPPGSGRPPRGVCGPAAPSSHGAQEPRAPRTPRNRQTPSLPARGGRQCPRLPSLASWPRRICVRGETQKRLERRRGPASGRLSPVRHVPRAGMSSAPRPPRHLRTHERRTHFPQGAAAKTGTGAWDAGSSVPRPLHAPARAAALRSEPALPARTSGPGAHGPDGAWSTARGPEVWLQGLTLEENQPHPTGHRSCHRAPASSPVPAPRWAPARNVPTAPPCRPQHGDS